MACVLVVDDNEDLRLLYTHALRCEGYSTSTAVNGQDALVSLKDPSTEKPHLILLDLMMPVMDGWEFLKAKSSSGEIADIPVVVCSAAPDQRLPKDVPVLRKPIDLGRLVDVVRPYCGDA